MKFTKTDRMKIEVSDQWYCWEVHLKMRKRVCEQVYWQVERQMYEEMCLQVYRIFFIPINYKILRVLQNEIY